MNTLAWLESKSFCSTPVDYLWVLGITIEETIDVNKMSIGVEWMKSIRLYLKKRELLPNKLEAKKLRYNVIRYTIIDNILYHCKFSSP